MLGTHIILLLFFDGAVIVVQIFSEEIVQESSNRRESLGEFGRMISFRMIKSLVLYRLVVIRLINHISHC